MWPMLHPVSALRPPSASLLRHRLPPHAESTHQPRSICRDLWLTIRSAYSARLPKGDLKLIYRDVDNDLMQLQPDEPWDNFKLVTRSLFLSSSDMPPF